MALPIRPTIAGKTELNTFICNSISILSLDSNEFDTYIKDAALGNPFLEISPPFSGASLNSDLFGIGTSSPYDFGRISTRQVTLEEYVKEQISYSLAPAIVKKAATYLIGFMDERGYLDDTGLYKSHLIDQAVALIQSFSPAGIGARNLSECLILQLIRKEELTETLRYICEHHLRDIAAGRFKQIAQALKISEDEVVAMVMKIKQLNPKPCASIGTSENTFVVPDVTVVQVGTQFVAVLNDAVLPLVSFSNLELCQIDLEEETSKYLNRKKREALDLIQMINYRYSSILAVASDIVQSQQNMFAHGLSCIAPMKMRETAVRLGISPSTVTRICKGKHLHFRGKTYPFRKFYSSSVSGAYGEVSSIQVKYLIREIINNENKIQPLSDACICKELAQRGIIISRRAVTKYRTSMMIPSSNIRRLL